jgi:hypothetical protein
MAITPPRLFVFVVAFAPFAARADAPRWVAAGAQVSAGDARSTFARCVDESRRPDAQGAPEVVWELVASCVEANVTLAGDPGVVARWSENRWVPEAASCPGPGATTAWSVAAHTCRAQSVVWDRDGDPVVDESAVSVCMAERGVVEVTPKAFVAWQQGCGAVVAAR